MTSIREILRPVLTKFLASVYVVTSVIMVLEQVIRGHDLAVLRDLYVPYVISQPLLFATGYAAGLVAMKSRLDEPAVSGTGRHVAAATFSTVALGLLSVVSQGAGHAFVIAACLSIGFVASAVFFLRPQRRQTAAVL
jgi:hypothetical protein